VALSRQGTDENLLPVDFDARATQGRKMPPPETAFVDGLPLQTQARFGDYMTTAMLVVVQFKLYHYRHARSLDAPLRYHRDRQRPLALQEPRITSHPPLANRQDRLASLYGTPGRRSRLRHSRARAGALLEAGRVGSDLTARGLKAGPDAGDSSQDLIDQSPAWTMSNADWGASSSLRVRPEVSTSQIAASGGQTPLGPFGNGELR
jgi:hypothetical protein